MRSLAIQHRWAVVATCWLFAVVAPALARGEEDLAPLDRETTHRALGFSLGLGIVIPSSSDASGYGEGVHAAAEHIVWPTSWFSPSLCAGIEVATPRSNCGVGVTPCDVSAEFGFVGVKGRLLAPIPWVAPYLELGVGAAIGHFSTQGGDRRA